MPKIVLEVSYSELLGGLERAQAALVAQQEQIAELASSPCGEHIKLADLIEEYRALASLLDMGLLNVHLAIEDLYRKTVQPAEVLHKKFAQRLAGCSDEASNTCPMVDVARDELRLMDEDTIL